MFLLIFITYGYYIFPQGVEAGCRAAVSEIQDFHFPYTIPFVYHRSLKKSSLFYLYRRALRRKKSLIMWVLIWANQLEYLIGVIIKSICF